jgi:hypothetical protein
MYRFDDLGQVQSTLQRLAQREPPVVKMLPRQPGTKEARYAHLLSGDVQVDAQPHVQPHAQNDAQMQRPEATRERGVAHSAAHVQIAHVQINDERIARLENELSALQNEVADLKQQLAAFRKQFE